MHSHNLYTHRSRQQDHRGSVSYRYRSRSHPFSRLQRLQASLLRHTTVRHPSTARTAPTLAAVYSLPCRLDLQHRTVDLQHRRPCSPIPTISSTKATTTSASRRLQPPSSRIPCISIISIMCQRKHRPCTIIPFTHHLHSNNSSSECNSTTARPTCASFRSR